MELWASFDENTFRLQDSLALHFTAFLQLDDMVYVLLLVRRFVRMQVHQFPHSDHRKPCSVYDVYLACKLFRRWAPITCERRLSFSSESRVSLRMGFSIPQSFELYSVSSRSRFMSRTSHGPLSHYMLLGTLEPTSPMGSKRERFAMTSRHGPLVCHQCARLVVDVLHGSQITPRLKSDNSCARPNAFLLAHGCPQRIADAI